MVLLEVVDDAIGLLFPLPPVEKLELRKRAHIESEPHNSICSVIISSNNSFFLNKGHFLIFGPQHADFLKSIGVVEDPKADVNNKFDFPHDRGQLQVVALKNLVSVDLLLFLNFYVSIPAGLLHSELEYFLFESYVIYLK